jgi:hypothetical protein
VSSLVGPRSPPSLLRGPLPQAVCLARRAAKFHLRGRDRATAQLNGPVTIRRHAGELITKRLAPADPSKDGKQTPYRGHPVFIALARTRVDPARAGKRRRG